MLKCVDLKNVSVMQKRRHQEFIFYLFFMKFSFLAYIHSNQFQAVLFHINSGHLSLIIVLVKNVILLELGKALTRK